MSEIPSILIDKIRKGNVGLFLGSGASYEAIHPKNKKIPLGNQLARQLSEEFLAGEYNDYSLEQVAELAISENDLFSVQSYIADIFKDFEPAEFHKIIPTLKLAIYSNNKL